MKRCRAFTMIELLTVLGIIAILIAFLLPSIHLARERARQIQCINNLKQISMALLNYSTTYETLPPGSIQPMGSVGHPPNGDPLSWTVQLLPFIEQSMIGSMVNYEVGLTHPDNQTVRMTQISTLMCPASRPKPEASALMNPGLSSYAGCHHDVESPIATNNHGVLFLNSSIRAADIGDGLSQTMFFGEIPMPAEPGWASGTRSTLRNTGHPINQVDLSIPGLLALPEKRSLTGSLSLLDLERMTHDGSASVPDTFVGGFGSRHPGNGSDFAFGDGSVRFLHTTIDLDVYRRLGNRDDGEVIDDETAY